ncbi:MAG: DinB family protein [Actinomycetota bacterium]|nr:DinB family protein [Actinomycetota bacterium]
MPTTPTTDTIATDAITTDAITTDERADLLEALGQHRFFLRFTVRDLTDGQAALSPSASQLCLGGLIKHVAEVESSWVDFIVGGPEAMAHASDKWSESDAESWQAKFGMQPGETLAGVLEHYEKVARRTDEVVATVANLGDSHPLPEAPWFQKGARWSARRVVLHIIAETAQHAGHADIIRETLDGSKTMG